MKKKLIFISLIPVWVIIIAFGISGYISSRADSDGFVVSDGVLVSYSGQSKDIIIPAGVESIGPEAFIANPMIESVTIGDGVKSIDSRAFSECINLKKVVIGDDVTVIGDSVFSGCRSLNDISVGNGLEQLGDGVFSSCTSLDYVSISSPNFLVSEGCIYDKDITHLYQYLPGYYSNKYKMPGTVSSISKYSFWGADNLEEIECSGSLPIIDQYVFANATGLKKIIINTPVNKIKMGAFDNCTALLQIETPVSLSEINENAFNNVSEDLIFVCDDYSYAKKFALEHGYLISGYSQISIEQNEKPANSTVSSDSVSADTYIDPFIELNHSVNNGTYSFSDSVIPEGTVLSDTVIVSDRAFLSLDGLDVNEGKDYTVNMKIIDNFCHYRDSSLNSYTIPDDVMGIGRFAFARSSLTDIVIPDGVTTIGYAAFYHCDNLSEISIPATVTKVEKYAFDYTPWYNNWLNDENADDFLIVGAGVLVGYKGDEENPDLPSNVYCVAEGVFDK